MRRLAFVMLLGCGASPTAEPATADAPAQDTVVATPSAPAADPVESNGNGPGCTGAVDAWIEQSGGEAQNPPPEYDAELKKGLSRGTYLNECRVPSAATVRICAAVLDGTVRGVTVSMDSAEQEHADCVAEAILRMQFTPQPMMALTRTQFDPSP
ncbi:MAG TPA: hypothetical protein VFB62_07130 [Polyangiaceae bacterium]|jgi:hypothetical protein|nr:hypothetical protein [Polyangiaceae bacterium]